MWWHAAATPHIMRHVTPFTPSPPLKSTTNDYMYSQVFRTETTGATVCVSLSIPLSYFFNLSI